MAEEIFRQKVFKRGLGEQFEIDSAGTYGGHAGELADPRMREAAHCRGYCLTHRSRQFRVADFDDFDRIVVMDDGCINDVGTHEELMQRCSIYSETYIAQTVGNGDFDKKGEK